jgi:2-succinyl-5-enolpyruvyl-6-hydroxy-3-cyclohexene-1-carboxylate synthase
MTTPDVTTSFALTLVDEFARAGVTNAVVAPGSRNTPLVLALARDSRVAVDVVLDERSAAFRALGMAMSTGRPVVICCTSGTAAANLHPAVIEARHARVPLLVCTADRPPELRGVGAAQTIDQTHLFGRAVNWFGDLGPPDAATARSWRPFASRAVAEALGPPAGPVHLNLPFREPLVPRGASLIDVPGRERGETWTRAAPVRRVPDDTTIGQVEELVRANPRGVIVAGTGANVGVETVTRFAMAAGWPVFADPLSNVRAGQFAISAYEALARASTYATAHRPELVLRLGAPLTSKHTNAWLEGVPQVLVDPDGAWLDPTHEAMVRIAADGDLLLDALARVLTPGAPETPWLEEWCGAERRARAAMNALLDADDIPCEATIARDVARSVPHGGRLAVASSLPVRALEWCMEPRDDLRVSANRGANGIDGFVSTVIGIARAAGPVTAVCGDLCFLHDSNGLLGVPAATPATFVVIDNNGGQIFSYLAQHDLPEFEQLFATPQGVDLAAVARALGAVVGDGDTDGPRMRVVVAKVDPDASRAKHARMWDAATRAVE